MSKLKSGHLSTDGMMCSRVLWTAQQSVRTVTYQDKAKTNLFWLELSEYVLGSLLVDPPSSADEDASAAAVVLSLVPPPLVLLPSVGWVPAALILSR